MSYKTLYRTYRPQQFNDVVGQQHITKTFMNALEQDKLSHAYLFTGPRGTGKTSIAKIIAKAANCEAAPVNEPCNACSSCTSINAGFDNDIFEIDAASHNGVDEIRELRDKVKYAPTSGRYKVYIIDEVHMLSTGAFNALLKTLEEPPKHALFILATTEPHKIPATIISRCQRFDFRSISVKDIVGRINQIVAKENIEIEEPAVVTIAKTAQGGMRDALSLLDQAISYSNDMITEEDVHEVAGTISEVKMIEIVEMLVKQQPQFAIQVIDELVSLGKEPLRLVENLIYFYRDMFLIKKMTTIDEALISNHSEKTIQLSNHLSEAQLYQLIAKLNDIQYEMRKTNTPRVFLELAAFEMEGLINSANNPVVKEAVSTQPVQSLKREQVEMSIQDTEKVEEPEQVEELTKIPPEAVKGVEYEEKYIDAKEIEYILNNANKEKKLTLVMQWQSIYGNDIHHTAIEQLLVDGQLEAISNDNQIILSYEQDVICARLYEEPIYQQAIQILHDVFGERFSILALPKRIWEDKREEFIEQFRQKVKNPQLTPISEPIIIRRLHDRHEHEPEIIKEVMNLFSEDIIEIKS